MFSLGDNLSFASQVPSGVERAIPKACHWGGKTNSQRKYEYWKGYKLHVSVVSGGLPVACLLTSASVHDSQAAPFLIKKTARKVQGYYLADAAVTLRPSRRSREIWVSFPSSTKTPGETEKRRRWSRTGLGDTKTARWWNASLPGSRTSSEPG